MNETAALLKEILVYTHRGSVQQVAETAGLAYQTVLDQTDGKINPSVHVIKASWLVTQDPRLKRLLEPEGFELVPRGQPRPTRGAEGESMDVVMALGNLTAALRDAKGDGRVSKAERVQIQKLIAALKKEVGEAEAAIEKEI